MAKSTDILTEAREAVSGDRMRHYGHPADNHACTAAMWSAYLSRTLGLTVKLSAEDVCMLNILQKVSREANLPKRDNLVDIVGYARNVELIQERNAATPA